MMPVSRRSAALATLTGNGLTVAITVAQAFLLIPLALSVLDASLYGAWIAASELLIWIQLLDGGLPNLLMQRAGAAVGRNDYVSAARWSSTVFAGLAIIGVSLLAVALVGAPLVSAWSHVSVGDRDTFAACFRAGALASVVLLMSNGCVALSRGVQRTALVSATQVAGALVGLLVSVVLLASGWGLWALPVGLLARAGLVLAGALVFVRSLPRAGVSWWSAPSRDYASEVRVLAPSMSAGSIGYVVANNSEILLVNTFFGPVPALAYALTRRAFDGARNLLDTIGWSVAGGFAHLAAANDRHRARAVLRDVLWLRVAAACLAAAVVASVNQAVVALLFGPDHFGGVLLTAAFAVHIVVVGQAFLANFLWRSTGHVREGSLLLAAEAVARVGAMVAGLWLIGLVGAPVASIIVSTVALVLAVRSLSATLPTGPDRSATGLERLAPPLVLGGGLVVAATYIPTSWVGTAVVAVAVGVIGCVTLWLVRPTALRSPLSK